MGKNKKPKWYAVRKGHQTGIFTVWKGGAQEATERFGGSCHQSFDNLADAKKFMNNEILCSHNHCIAERMKHGPLTPSVKMDPVVDSTKASCGSTDGSPILQEKRQPKIELPYTPSENMSLPYLIKEEDVVDSETPFPPFDCHGIKVLFPNGKTPYPVQKEMISKLLQSLKGVTPETARVIINNNTENVSAKVFNLKPPGTDGLIPGNCLLESPTGTGKTITLLSAALAWLQHEKDSRVSRKPAGLKLPRIFYGTRTHKQITQIVSELKTTPYANDIKMTTLSSRKNLCLKDDRKNENRSKDAICQELLAPHGCGCNHLKMLNNDMKDSAERVREEIGKNEKVDSVVFDIEDLHLVGKEKDFCPYYAGTKTLMKDSELIFCPYNYLMDPMIREAMNLDLAADVVILDEGHNVEDVCRDSASFTLDTCECSKLSGVLYAYLKGSEPVDLMRGKKAAALRILNRCNTIAEWLQNNCSDLDDANDSCENYDPVEAPEIIQHHLEKDLGFDAQKGMQLFQADFDTLTTKDKVDAKEFPPPPSKTALRFVEKIIHLLKFFYSTSEAKENYRLCFQRFDKKLSAGFWCMNPALAFKDAFGTCRSVIIASGTLSPMNTFASELGTDFLHKLEGEHVVPKDNYRNFALEKGPNGYLLRCVKKVTELSGCQDELGHLVLSVCQCVPDGVLCFVSSYSLMYQLKERWTKKGILAQIETYKKTFFEPRGSSDKTADVATEYFRTLYDLKKCTGDSGVTGALFLAVMRGKVSEGLDFNDEYARAVITVGIPYPNLVDPKVTLKCKFNDQKRTTDALVLSGDDWYETQAFRALNQSLGRCLRYKNDWGSIIMVDQRFVDPRMQAKYKSGVSKWVRSDIKSMNNFKQFTHELLEFSQEMQAKTEKENNGARVVSTKAPKTGEVIRDFDDGVPDPNTSPIANRLKPRSITWNQEISGPEAKRRKTDVP